MKRREERRGGVRGERRGEERRKGVERRGGKRRAEKRREERFSWRECSMYL